MNCFVFLTFLLKTTGSFCGHIFYYSLTLIHYASVSCSRDKNRICDTKHRYLIVLNKCISAQGPTPEVFCFSNSTGTTEKLRKIQHIPGKSGKMHGISNKSEKTITPEYIYHTYSRLLF